MTQNSLNKSKAKYKGRLLGIENNVIFGWAYENNNPDKKLVLEVLLDGYPANLIIANMFCKDYFSESFGDNSFGFISQISPSSLNISHRINIRVANSNHLLDGDVLIGKQSILTKNDKAKPIYPLLDSMLVYASGLKITGHYMDPISPDINPELYFYDDNKLLFSQLLKQKQNQVYQVKTELPAYLADGKQHNIKILDNKKRELKGSPLAVTVYPHGVKKLISGIVEEKKFDLDSPIGCKIKLLENLFEQYNKYLPASFGFENYAYWHQVFSPHDITPFQSNKSIAVLIYGQGDVKRSIASLKQQSLKNWKAVVLEEELTGKSTKNIYYIEKKDFQLNTYIVKNKIVYVTLLKAGDHLPNYALENVIRSFEKNNSSIEYSDVDYDDQSGNRSNPWFKPDWDYELFLSQNYLNELFAVKSKVIPSNYAFDVNVLPFCCIKNLFLNDLNDIAGSKIHHIPEVLYHKQYESESKPDLALAKNSAQVIQEILDLSELGSEVKRHPTEPTLRRIKKALNEQPLVSIIIPTRDQYKLLKCCIKTLLEKTEYQNFEIIIVDNQSRDKKTLKYLKKLAEIKKLRILDYPKQFNYSAINNYAVSQARGEVIALVNNDIEFKDKYWLTEMLSLLLRDNVGAVGCKLIWPNGMVQHGGVVLGINGLADHAFNTIAEDEPGYFYRAQVTQQYSAVTAACLLTRKKDYLSVDGLNEVDFPVAFNDVDYCLKLRKKGKRVVWTPFVKIIHAESASRGKDSSAEKAARATKEMNNLKRRWGHEIMHDPFYNPNLNLDHLSGSFSGLAIPPRKLNS